MYGGGGARGSIDAGAREKLEQQAIRIARLEAQVAELTTALKGGDRDEVNPDELVGGVV